MFWAVAEVKSTVAVPLERANAKQWLSVVPLELVAWRKESKLRVLLLSRPLPSSVLVIPQCAVECTAPWSERSAWET